VRVSATARVQPASPAAQLAPVLVAVRAEPIASAAGIFHGGARETEVPSGAVPGDSTARPRAVIAIVAPRVGDLAAAQAPGAVASVVAADSAAAVVSVAVGEAAEAVADAAGSRADLRTAIAGAT
jgi:hypothetical protein